MEEKDKIIMKLKQENQVLRRENNVIRNELMKYSGVNLTMLLNNNNIPTNNNNQHMNYNYNNNLNGNFMQNPNQMQMFPNNYESNFNRNLGYQNQNSLVLPPIQLNNNTPNNLLRRNNSISFSDFIPNSEIKKSTPYSLQEKYGPKQQHQIMNNLFDNNSNNFMMQNQPSNHSYKNESRNSLIETPINKNSMYEENLRLKEKISNLENAFLGGSSSLISEKSKVSKENFFNEKDEKEDTSAVKI